MDGTVDISIVFEDCGQEVRQLVSKSCCLQQKSKIVDVGMIDSLLIGGRTVLQFLHNQKKPDHVSIYTSLVNVYEVL